MTETSLTALRQLFLQRYERLRSRLARHLGSADLAGEALQDTWLRLERGEGISRSEAFYLLPDFLAETNRIQDLRSLGEPEPENA
jgi:hypothetical protein